MKLRILTILVAMFSVVSAAADEGMWLPSLIGSRIDDMRAKGFRLTAEDIYSINQASMKDAVVLFDGGCTGEIVSPEGLLLTNHHCGYGAIQKHSSVEHDYLANGFWAMSRTEELPNPGMYVAFLVRMEDVTDEVLKGVKDDMDAEARNQVIASNEKKIRDKASENGRYDTSVESLYYGNQYFLFVYEKFTDVRLVGAPPSAIGKFGGDTDNWMWPRHTGDFSVFRVYAGKDNRPADYSPENVPYRPKRHFEISVDGVEEGDFTMIYGFPGNTQRYVISDAAEYVAEWSDPAKIKLRTLRLDIISKAQEKDPAVRIQYAAKHANIANAWKKWQGEVLGLKRLGTVEKKRRYEAQFAEWASQRPEYAHLLDSMHAAYASLRDAYFRSEYFAESINAIELAQITRYICGARPAADNAAVAAFFKDYVPAIDRDVAVAMINEFMKDIPAEYVPKYLTDRIAEYGSVEKYVDAMFESSRFTSPERFAGVAADSAAYSAAIENDMMQELLNEFALCGHFSARRYRNMSDAPQIALWYRPYMRALMEYDRDEAFFPDANLTLRVAYGKVGGYDAADGIYHKHCTTLDGIIEKYDPAISDYAVPQQLYEIYESKDYGRWGTMIGGRYTVPVAFIASNHTTGGNSGSPVINGDGRLIGINFDRTWLSTMSDIEFDPKICRNIAVDIRYVLFVIDRIGGASYLLDEMGVGEAE